MALSGEQGWSNCALFRRTVVIVVLLSRFLEGKFYLWATSRPNLENDMQNGAKIWSASRPAVVAGKPIEFVSFLETKENAPRDKRMM